MVQATAQILDFKQHAEVYEARTRTEALKKIASGEAFSAQHEHVVNPLVRQAAGHLIQNQKDLKIQLFDLPHKVLEQAAEKLSQAGVSSRIANKAMAALEEHIVNMGADFSREAKAKPLAVRLQVTDQEPEDLPECEQTFATTVDEAGSYGSEAVTMVRYLSIFGSKSTSSQGVDMDKLFETKKSKLLIFFGANPTEGVKGFNSIDGALMNAMQGLGGEMSAEAMAELKEMIQNGELSPEAIILLENLAELSQLQEAMLTPNAVENGEVKLTELTKIISEQIAQGIENGTLPSSIITASINVLADAGQSKYLSSIIDATADTNIIADNDNPDALAEVELLVEKLTELSNSEGLDEVTLALINEQIDALTQALDGDKSEISAALSEVTSELSELVAQEGLSEVIYSQISEMLPIAASASQAITQASSLSEQLSDLSSLGSEDLLNLIQELAQTESLPPQLQELINQIDAEIGLNNLTPETLKQVLSSDNGGSALAQAVQGLVISLDTPDIQSALSQAVLNSVNQFLDSNSTLTDAVATLVVIQNLESTALDIDPNSPQIQSIENVINDLKSGAETMATLDAAVLQAIATQGDAIALTAIEGAITTLQTSQAESIVLSSETISALSNNENAVKLASDVEAKLNVALASNDSDAVLAVIAFNPEVVAFLPPEVQNDVLEAIPHSAPYSAPDSETAYSNDEITDNAVNFDKGGESTATPELESEAFVKPQGPEKPVDTAPDTKPDNEKVEIAEPVEDKNKPEKKEPDEPEDKFDPEKDKCKECFDKACLKGKEEMVSKTVEAVSERDTFDSSDDFDLEAAQMDSPNEATAFVSPETPADTTPDAKPDTENVEVTEPVEDKNKPEKKEPDEPEDKFDAEKDKCKKCFDKACLKGKEEMVSKTVEAVTERDTFDSSDDFDLEAAQMDSPNETSEDANTKDDNVTSAMNQSAKGNRSKPKAHNSNKPAKQQPAPKPAMAA